MRIHLVLVLMLSVSLTECGRAPASSDQSDSSDLESISDVESMVRLPNGSFQVHCRNGTTETRSEGEILANQVCVGGSPSGNFVYGNTDNCSTDYIITSVTEATNCDALSGQSSWSVRINGSCQNISDTTANKACMYVQGNMPNAGTIFGSSDNCSTDSTLGIVNRFTSCDKFSDSGSAWSISVNGACQNISDTSPRRACFEIKGNIAGGGIVYGSSDNCSADAAIYAVDYNTDCNQLSTSTSAWSVKVNGTCRNISDTNLRNACLIVQGG